MLFGIPFVPSNFFVGLFGLISLIIFLDLLENFVGENLEDPDWVYEYMPHLFTLWGALGFILTPLLTATIYQAPLLLFFPSLSAASWWGILTSALLLGFRLPFKGTALDPYSLNDRLTSQAIKEQTARDKNSRIVMVGDVVSRCLVGVIAGYCTITYQTLWAGVGVYVAWGMVAILLGLLMATFAFIGLSAMSMASVRLRKLPWAWCLKAANALERPRST